MKLEYHHGIQVACLITGILLYRKNWPVAFKALMALVAVSVIVELSGAFISGYLKQENSWLYNIYVVVLSLLTWFIFQKLAVSRSAQISIQWIGISYLAAVAGCYIVAPGIIELNTYAFSITFIFYCVLSCIYIIDMFTSRSQIQQRYDPGFWFMTAIFLMSILYVSRFAFFNIMQHATGIRYILDYFVYVVNTIMYGGFIISFICLHRNSIKYSPL